MPKSRDERQGAGAMEPALRFEDVCRLRAVSTRTGQRERSAGAWPEPAYHVGVGS
jgi:hypothetical protein